MFKHERKKNDKILLILDSKINSWKNVNKKGENWKILIVNKEKEKKNHKLMMIFD